MRIKGVKQRIFLYKFLQRNIECGDSLILLTEKGFFHVALLGARNMFEGTFYFEAFIRELPLAEMWLLFAMCEDYQNTLRDFGKEAAEQRLSYYKSLPEESFERAKKKFTFSNKQQKWYNAKRVERKPNVRELANFIDKKEREARPQREWLIEKAGAAVKYNTMYHIYS